MESQCDGTDARVDDVTVWDAELLPTDHVFHVDHTGDDLFAEARVGSALV